jgi:hypothetical protein
VKNCRIGKRNPKVPSILYRNVPQALMMNETKALVYFEPKVDKFKLEKFALL